MTFASKAMLAGLAAIAVAGAAIAADAGQTHILNVALPDGRIAHIRYQGDVPPRIVLHPAVPVALPGFGVDPFAMMERISAEMDARANLMLRQAAALQAETMNGAAPVRMTSAGGKPSGGMMSYSYVSSTGGANGGCTQSVRMISSGAGQPRVTRAQAGDCAGVAPLMLTGMPAAAGKPAAPVVKTSAPKPPATTVRVKDTI